MRINEQKWIRKVSIIKEKKNTEDWTRTPRKNARMVTQLEVLVKKEFLDEPEKNVTMKLSFFSFFLNLGWTKGEGIKEIK